jgi:hypothetical protein
VTEIEELARTLVAIGEAFERIGAVWAVGGSLASAAYGEPRATNDVDVIADLDEASARAFARDLAGQFHADADVAASAAAAAQSFNVIDERSFIKVDVFVPPPGPMGQGQLDRRRILELLPGVEVPVLAPEDVVLQKLRCCELGGGVSDRQWRDIVAVLRGEELDGAYLDAVAARAGLAPLLHRARLEASES